MTPFIKLNISISAISNSLCFIHCTCIGTVHHRRSYHCLAYFPIDPNVYYSMKHNPEYHLPVCHHDCILCGIPALVSPLSAYVAPKYLNVVTLSIFSPSWFEFPSTFPSPLNIMYTFFFLQALCIFSSLSSISLLRSSSIWSAFFVLVLYNAMPSANAPRG